MCAPIDGTDVPRLASCLGLDVSKFQNVSTHTAEKEELYTFESTIPERERFKDVEKWAPQCNSCKECSEFKGFARDAAVRLFISCEHANVQGQAISSFECSKCHAPMRYASLSMQLVASMRKFMAKYLDQSVVCEDPACRTRTRACGVYGQRCLMPGCKGIVVLEYSDAQLYTQMQYYERILSIPHFQELWKSDEGT